MTTQHAANLQQLVWALIRDATTPRAIRNECHRLMCAIDINDHSLIRESVARLEQLATEANVTLSRP